MSKKFFNTLLIISVGLALLLTFVPQNTKASARVLPEDEPHHSSSAPGYCSSYGGSHAYEYISNVTYTKNPGGTMSITVNIHIANPTGCVAGKSCPEYDNSPEYINVWVDWNGNQIFESGEKVMDVALTGYLGINYHGTMTTSNIVTIPANAAAITWMRTNLGWGYDPNNPCQLYWTWGDIVDKKVQLGPIKVVQLDALNDIDIQGITDPIWKKQFDANGNLVDVSPAEDDPVADDMKSGSFKIKATLDGFPGKPAWSPKVKYDWTLPGASGSGEFIGWTGSFDVTVPQKVGVYSLGLQFTVKDDQNNVVETQSISRKLYVTYDTPLLSPPKEIWLEKATNWANTATNPSQVNSKLNQGIYTNAGWLYRDGATSWSSLVEGTASQGNCVSFSNVWNNLTKVLGVSGNSTQQTRGSHSQGFVTKSATALDGLKGNAHPAAAPIDRWVFGMHQVGKDSGYFDPTFGAQYSGIFDFIEWHFTGATGSDAHGFYYVADGHKVYPKSSSPPWGDYEYHSPSNPDNPSPEEGVNFTGNYSEQGIDIEGDGIYNSLGIKAEVDVTKAGDYSIFGLLRSGDTIITSRSSFDSAGFSAYYLSAEPGIKTVSLNFSGEDIYNQGIDGIYTIDLWLFDKNGVLIEIRSFNTSSYVAKQFGEVPARIVSALDHGKDLDGDGLFDYLTAEVSLEVINSMDYGLEGTLYSQDNLITSVYVKTSLSQGVNVVKLNFSGQEIENAEFNGPYILIVNLHNENDHQIDQKEFETLAYQYADFEKNGIKLSGLYSDHGQDTDGDGLYNYLRVKVGVNVVSAGNYNLVAWLSDNQGNDIIWSSTESFLNAGSQVIVLDFDGLTIYEQGIDGPYLLRYIVLKDAADNLIEYQEDVYTTSSYNFTDFQQPQTPLITLTGSYWDYGSDTDGDGTFDYLAVDVEVMLANPGYTVIKARLMDIQGEEIVWANKFVYLEAGQPQIIQLNFDGKAIYAHGVDGPYYLRDVYLYHTGDPLQPDYVYEAYTTGFYSYVQFGENIPPIADTNGPYQGNEGSPIVLDGSGSSDSDGTIVLYEWDLDGDGLYDDATGINPSYTWGDNYSGTIGLKVTDNDGLTATDSTTIIVNNVAPDVEAGLDQEVYAGDAVNLSGSFTDPGWLDTHTIEWDFGNGNGTTGTLTPSYVYYDKGAYAVTLTITDDDGGIGTDTLQIVVKSIPATIDCDPDTLNLKSKGNWITCYIEMPEGYDVWQIDGSTILLNGLVPVYLGKQGWAKAESNESNIMDNDGDGILERMVKFDRDQVQSILSPGQAVLALVGKVAGADFEGSDTIRVIE